MSTSALGNSRVEIDNYQGLLGTESGRLENGSFGPNNNQRLWIPAQAANHRGLLPE